MATPGERLRATVVSLIAAVEQALEDEALFDREPAAPDDDELAAADAVARAYEAEA